MPIDGASGTRPLPSTGGPIEIPSVQQVPHFVGRSRIEHWERPVPRPGRGELLIAVRANALCGTDRHQLEHGSPVTPGHEAAGVVASAGPATTTRAGTHGVVYLMDFCGSCRSCRLDLTNHSAAPDSGGGLCLAVATASDPTGPFTDVGQPLECGEGFVNIDPMAFQDPPDGRWLLFWGSGFEPSGFGPLSPDGLSWADGSTAVDVLAPDAFMEYENLVEGAWVVKRSDWYYLFYSGDSCCSDPHYAVLVARSRAATGPYEKLATARASDSSAIVVADRTWNAPGHNAIATDAAGRDWLVYHAIDRARPFHSAEFALSRPTLIDPIAWVDGWPRVLTGDPSTGPQTGPAVP